MKLRNFNDRRSGNDRMEDIPFDRQPRDSKCNYNTNKILCDTLKIELLGTIGFNDQ